MNYRYYTTTTKKEPMNNSSLKWVINELSNIDEHLKNKELRVDGYLRKDLKEVLKELNITINQMISGVH